MTTFFALLSAYYICDAAAAVGTLTLSEITECVHRYEAVKAEFVPPDASGPEAGREGYRRFKAWEAENPEIVARMKSEAEHLIQKSRLGEPV